MARPPSAPPFMVACRKDADGYRIILTDGEKVSAPYRVTNGTDLKLLLDYLTDLIKPGNTSALATWDPDKLALAKALWRRVRKAQS